MMKYVLAAALFAASTAGVFASEPIVGKWRAPGGGIVEVKACGGAYCATVISGEHKGKKAGRMSGNDGQYTGTVIDPRDDRSYNGKARIQGSSLKLTGCALKVFCKTQTWTRT